jgi:aminoglycoside 3-N-acetyltransferase
MLSYRDLTVLFQDLGLGSHSLAMLHGSMASTEPVAGGPETVVGALLGVCEMVIAPTFTYRTMVTPKMGPADNALEYGEDAAQVEAEIFHPAMPADPGMGILAEVVRQHPHSKRSVHPILSFAGIHAEDALEQQTLENPFGPIEWLAEFDGDIVLLSVDHRTNISIHLGEQLAGRKTFTRWALTSKGVVACPNFPGCPEGFNAITSKLGGVARRARLDQGWVDVIPLRDLLNVITHWVREDPTALLCSDAGCARCSVVRG